MSKRISLEALVRDDHAHANITVRSLLSEPTTRKEQVAVSWRSYFQLFRDIFVLIPLNRRTAGLYKFKGRQDWKLRILNLNAPLLALICCGFSHYIICK